jgi:hypothetical protein
MRRVGARVVGSAFADYFRNLSEGDPTALILTFIFLILFAFVGGVFLYDKKSQQKKGKGKSRAR